MNSNSSAVNPDRGAIQRRAEGRCEYCRIKEAMVIAATSFHIEHIRPRKEFPPDDPSAHDPDNLAWSCPKCNNAKRTKTSFNDPKTGQIERLFNPRIDKWDNHFIALKRTGRIEGKTAIGRATVEALKFNEPPERVENRLYWGKLSQWP
jgi:uncharacterized protein (TIGR02646 family)